MPIKRIDNQLRSMPQCDERILYRTIIIRLGQADKFCLGAFVQHDNGQSMAAKRDIDSVRF